jgi:hypothetical protein
MQTLLLYQKEVYTYITGVRMDIQPTESQDEDQGDLLSAHNLQAPDTTYGQYSDHHICDRVRAAVAVSNCILVETSGGRPLGHIPESIHWLAFEGECEKRDDASNDTDRHYDVYRYARFIHREYSSILHQDGELHKNEAKNVGKNARIEVLCQSAGIYQQRS